MTTQTSVQTVHVIFKTHLDIGFTDFARNVVEQYHTRFIPRAIATAEALRERGGDERLVWTTGSWLIYEHLEQAGPDARRHMEAAIASGEPSLLDFNNDQPSVERGMHVNLYNNVWGTNFRMWYDDDTRFRFTMRFT